MPTPFQALSLIQSNFGTPGNLELVSSIGDQLARIMREGLADVAQDVDSV
jgi:hypothetical protein